MLSAVIPLVSVLVGAAITYWLNVHTRRRSAVDDLFALAVAAVAAAEASANYVSSVSSWQGATDEEYQAFLKDMRREASLRHINKMAEAREALARVLPYQPTLRDAYRAEPPDFLKRIDSVIELLLQGPARPRRKSLRSATD